MTHNVFSQNHISKDHPINKSLLMYEFDIPFNFILFFEIESIIRFYTNYYDRHICMTSQNLTLFNIIFIRTYRTIKASPDFCFISYGYQYTQFSINIFEYTI